MSDAIRQLWTQARAKIRSDEGFGIVETLIAFTILVIGLLAVSGLTLASSTQARVADRWNDVATAGQIAIEMVQFRGYDSATNRTDTVSVSGKDYPVTLTVTSISSRVREVQAVVDASGPASMRTFTARVHRPRSLPMPYDSVGGGGGGGGGGGTPSDTTAMPGDTTGVPVDSVSIASSGCTDAEMAAGLC